MSNFTQNNYDKASGKQIGEMRDYYEGKSITIGFSAEDVNQIMQTIQKLKKEDREKIEGYFAKIKAAQSESEKKSLAIQAVEVMGRRVWGIFDSLVASAICAIIK